MSFDIDNYTAEDLANASAADLEQLLKDLDVGSNKRKFFTKFDTDQIEDIMASFETKMKSLSTDTSSKIQGLKGEMQKAGQGVRSAMGKSGLTSGSLNPMKFQSSLFSQVGDVSKQKTVGMQQFGLEEKQAKKSAYDAYEERFMAMLGAIKG